MKPMDRSARLLQETPDAPWLPPGGCAQVWVGSDCDVPEPAVIVRLLLTRSRMGRTEFFCIQTPRGLDLPTRVVGSVPPLIALEQLVDETVGASAASVGCVGFVRNVVAQATEDYTFPVPLAHVPVFEARGAVTPRVPGTWLGVDEATALVDQRHWWPIVRQRVAG